MKLVVEKTEKLEGEITIPGSKSHTIRAVIIASLAEGISKIKNPLKSDDTMAAVNACTAFGAKINTDNESEWVISGFNHNPQKPEGVINMMNSGTSLRLISGVIAALCDFEIELDGDASLRARPMQPLLKSLNQLGAEAVSVSNNGYCPIKIKGKMIGGDTEVVGMSSQYISSLLIACPLLEEDTEIRVVKPNEIPYILITMKWLDEQGIKYEVSEDFTKFKVFGKQRYKSFEKSIPADWSSAAFPLVGAAIVPSNVLLKGLDINDVQGDKAIIDYLKKMDADVSIEGDGIRIKGKALKGCELDLNATPDALPALAVLGCFAEGTTVLFNVPQARIKETDRIKVMTEELERMGADIKERDEGLIIHKSELKGNKVRGHSDHRIVMALSLAGMISTGKTEITTAESIGVTFPDYAKSMKALGAKIEVV
ncbi:MAG: 3-phosphoshikimate 1-carboxyvinyltransferase [Nanoarchaeota archaeon]|nr:3-phosphoshikimate 1-carboxyvinyltransferase [Nanoarchaeota archaeon]MBU1946299.1 3-phosphoshikimate 1-carboxyvinyltransferase [Nanoarchaeota archaeon]